jgi:tetratricopeptide (TPR) repeat protein
LTRKTLLSLATATTLTLFAAGCGTTAAPQVSAPQPQVTADTHFIDPRIGFDGAIAPVVQRRFDAAWSAFQTGDLVTARKRFAELQAMPGGLPPATLAEAAIDLREGKLDEARAILEPLQRDMPHYTAVLVYSGELALARHDEAEALGRYRAAGALPGAPSIVQERAAELQRARFERVMQTVNGATSDDQAVAALREALTIDPSSQPARILLTRKLVALKRWDEARRELDPLLNSTAVDLPEVQESLAEMDAGRGRYQEAIVRYERLSHRDQSGRFNARLNELKEAWNSANMPPQFQSAMSSEAITRRDLAVLLYWRVQSIRFAQNLGTPPIAVDLGSDAEGREEIIRSIALGILQVDPMTRRVDPSRPINSGMFSRYLARVLSMRGAACARNVQLPPGTNDVTRTQSVLTACGVSDPAQSAPDAPVSGATAAEALAQLNRALSPEKR